MISSLSLFIVSAAYPTGSDATAQSIIGVMLSINILISLLMLPINIRLAAQLIMQVFKYRYILKRVAEGDVDTKVMRGYYDHFKVVMCIILFMIGYNVFNVISSVYFLVYFVKSDWGFHPWYIYIAQGLYAAFQDGIILFAITLFYQVTCYFEEKAFRFQIVCFLALLRSIYILVQVGVINNLILNKYTPDLFGTFDLTTRIILFGLYTLSGLYLLEPFVRFPFVFSFIRVSQRVVKTYIHQFNTNLNTQFLDRSHYVDKIQASMLFQIAGWGTISVSFFTSVNIFGQYVLASMLITYEFLAANSFSTIIDVIILIALTIVQIVTTLPVILYSIFLIALWLYFRYKTKAKYSGYSSNDPKILEIIHNNDDTRETTTNQDSLHTTYYKPKNTIIISVYVVTVLLISLLFACFFAPLLTEKWKHIIQMKSGDYYILDKTDLGDNLNSCHKDHLSISVFNNPYSPNTPIQDCQNSTIYATKFIQPLRIQNKTYTYVYQDNPNSDTSFSQFWIPKDSVLIASLHSLYEVMNITYLPYMAIETVDPCYVGFLSVFRNQFGLFWCKSAVLNEDFSTTAVCYLTSNTTVNCTIQNSGMFTFISFPYETGLPSAYTSKFFDGTYEALTYRNGPITVQQFGYEVNESTLVPLKEAKNQIDKYDVILAPTSENITNLNSICTIQFTCNFNLAFTVLIPVLIFTVSMVGLALGLYCIYKI